MSAASSGSQTQHVLYTMAANKFVMFSLMTGIIDMMTKASMQMYPDLCFRSVSASSLCWCAACHLGFWWCSWEWTEGLSDQSQLGFEDTSLYVTGEVRRKMQKLSTKHFRKSEDKGEQNAQVMVAYRVLFYK